MCKSSWVHSRTQGVAPIVVADGQMYYGYCINCLYLAMGDNWDQGQWSFHISYLMFLLEMATYWHCIWTKRVCVLWNYLFPLLYYELGCNAMKNSAGSNAMRSWTKLFHSHNIVDLSLSHTCRRWWWWELITVAESMGLFRLFVSSYAHSGAE
jgi:hypothetical protein